MSLFDRVKKITNGVSILTDWLGSGGIVVAQELAQKRADVCLSCPLHSTTGSVTEVAMVAFKQQIEVKKKLKLRVNGEKQLHLCTVCGCAMRLKIWPPIEIIAPDAEERQDLHVNCWLLSESKP